MLSPASDPLLSPPACCRRHWGEGRNISLVSSSTAIHSLWESIAINKAIQKRQVQARQREHGQILSEPKAGRSGLSNAVCTGGKKKKVVEKELGRGRKAGPGRRGRHQEWEEPANWGQRFKNGMADPESTPGVQILTLPGRRRTLRQVTPPSLGWLLCKMRWVRS